MEEGVQERPPPATRPARRSRRMSVITVQEANAEQARAPVSPKRFPGSISFPDSARRNGYVCSDDADAENYWRKVLRSPDGPFGRAPSDGPLERSGNQPDRTGSGAGLNTMTLSAVSGSGTNCS